MDKDDIAQKLKERDYNIVWALEGLSISERTNFIVDALYWADQDSDGPIDGCQLKNMLHSQLPHIIWMFQTDKSDYYNIPYLIKTMAEHGVFYDADAERQTLGERKHATMPFQGPMPNAP